MIITIILPTEQDEVILTTACTKKNKLPSPYIQFYMSHDTGKKQAD